MISVKEMCLKILQQMVANLRRSTHNSMQAIIKAKKRNTN